MPFQKGRKKTGGRGKGVSNKATKTAREIMDAAGFNPIRRAMTLFNTTNDPQIKAQMLKLLVKHAYPELRAIEISGNPDKPIYVTNADARRKRIEELESKIKDVTPLIVTDATPIIEVEAE